MRFSTLSTVAKSNTVYVMARFGTRKESPLAVRLSSDVLEALRRMADVEERSLAWCLDTIARQHFEQVGELEPRQKPAPRRVVASSSS